MDRVHAAGPLRRFVRDMDFEPSAEETLEAEMGRLWAAREGL